MALLISVLEQGLCYAIMALGMYITYKILDFPDMTVDGGFPFGICLAVVMIRAGVRPIFTLPICFAAGCLIGVCTGIIHVVFKVRDLLAGIIMMTGLYSVNLRIAGKANLPMYDYYTIFDNKLMNSLFGMIPGIAGFQSVIILFVITIIVKFILDWYLKTRSGLMLQAVGDNDVLVTSMGVDRGKVRIIGLAIANGLVALSGSIYAQQQRYFDVSMGTGTAVIGLASVIIGTALLKKVSFFKITTSVVIGAIVYKACVAIAIKCGLQSTDLKLITAVLFLVILIITRDKKRKVEA
ncbi:ABC transporter permease [Butyrivibrio sp. AD3002]|uniref:ABC transporter permease n=1 Tax=Butyrivibrio sp. AD3002 TaxID=1280670 RepID=UPI0003B6BB82|nr:ABC transporter [Butyrivibrio sp. AD3002]